MLDLLHFLLLFFPQKILRTSNSGKKVRSGGAGRRCPAFIRPRNLRQTFQKTVYPHTVQHAHRNRPPISVKPTTTQHGAAGRCNDLYVSFCAVGGRDSAGQQLPLHNPAGIVKERQRDSEDAPDRETARMLQTDGGKKSRGKIGYEPDH